jgi:hypothetical protein
MGRKKATPDWQALNEKILAGLDLQAEFAALGIDITNQPKSDGWAECHAVGRADGSTDENPSAAVNCISGRYRDLGGEGLSLSLYDLAVHVRRFVRWQDARDYYAAKAGVKLEANGKGPRDPAEHLAFMSWSAGLVSLWCRTKSGVTPEAVQASGGRLARYRDQYTVIALPVFGPGFTAADPIGWVLYNTTGRELPIFHGRDKVTGKSSAPTWAKMKTTGGSDGGLLGQHAIDRLTAPGADPSKQIIWKVEGPSDMLALWAIIPPEKRKNHLVLTNSGGAQQNPLPWMQQVFAGRMVAVVGDADEPGQLGATKWAAWAAKVASEVRLVRAEQLGFEVEKSHGKDLRDWLAA